MKLKDKIHSFVAIIKVRAFHQRVPLAVRFQLTNRCTLQCRYCNLWCTKTNELSTREILVIIEQLAVLGTKRISFSGGEPLLREDIYEIVTFAQNKGIYAEMNSNGTLVPVSLKVLKKIDFLKLSLDGPKEAHDQIRGKGSYAKVMEAADAAFKNKVNFGFTCTVTKYNINSLDHLLDIAKKYETIVAFQPLKEIYRGVKDVGSLTPDKEDFKKAINSLIEKKRTCNNFRNSLSCLKHISQWPKYGYLKCWAGWIFCIINTNGDIYPCDRINYSLDPPNCLSLGVRKALDSLPEIHCSGCGFCGSLELNYLMCFRIGILNSLKKIINHR
jgi:MoaA/NifB/PqqE/SkfB family radical SAM enzyme